MDSIEYFGDTYKITTKDVGKCTVFGILGDGYKRYMYSINGLEKHMLTVVSEREHEIAWTVHMEDAVDVYDFIWEWLCLVWLGDHRLTVNWSVPDLMFNCKEADWMYSEEVVRAFEF